jgi:predicted transcriptional regulator
MYKGTWVSSWFRGEHDPLHAVLGRLEGEVMEVVWAPHAERGKRIENAEPAHTVKDVQSRLPRKAAYTTVMTTLDRLFKKGLVLRHREGRAFVYTAARTREEMSATLTGGLLRGVLSNGAATARPFLSNLVDAVGEGDSALLDELERLVRDKQAQTRKEPK